MQIELVNKIQKMRLSRMDINKFFLTCWESISAGSILNKTDVKTNLLVY